MNQILSVENSKKSNGPVDIGKILKIFGILILLFGIFLASNGSYALYKNFKEQEEIKNSKPTVFVEKNDEDTLIITARQQKGIEKIVYSWNDGEEISINANKKTYFEKVIELPTGENIIKVEVTAVNGQTAEYQQQYIKQEDPNIEISAVENKIKATVTSSEKIAYITYRWDEDDEIKEEINETSVEKLIEIPQGLHNLTVVAVTVNNKMTTKQQAVNGVTKPKVEVTTDGQNFIIHATDDEKLEKVEFTLNGQNYRLTINNKELNYSYPLENGENKIEVTVYNSNGLTATFKAKCTK